MTVALSEVKRDQIAIAAIPLPKKKMRARAKELSGSWLDTISSMREEGGFGPYTLPVDGAIEFLKCPVGTLR